MVQWRLIRAACLCLHARFSALSSASEYVSMRLPRLWPPIRNNRNPPREMLKKGQLSHPPTHWHASACHEPRRGPSDSLTSPEGVGRLFFTAHIERALSHRARSASKKNGLPTPSHHSETARYASTGDSPGHPSPCWRAFSASC